MDYQTLHMKTVADLRALAREYGVRVPAGTNKESLIQMLLKAPEPAPAAPRREPDRAETPQPERRRGRPRKEAPEPAAEAVKPEPAKPAPAQQAPASLQQEYPDARPAPATSRPRTDYTMVDKDGVPIGNFQDGAGVLEIQQEGYGFLRADNCLPGANDAYLSPAQIRRFNLREGDYIQGKTRPQRDGARYCAMVYVTKVNGEAPENAIGRQSFESLIPVYPNERLRMEGPKHAEIPLRLIDILSPIGKGQRGMIVSQPKAGKTTLLKQIANAISDNNPEVKLIVLLIDERPEEVTDMKRSIRGDVIYSTFDEEPAHHARVAEMVLERAERMVEMKQDVVILMDSITRLARAYNLIVPTSGRSLSGGLDPGALYKPKKFFGAARNIENGGSLTIIATALVDTGSRMDDIIFEEFKGTGNMELHLDRKLADRRIFPAIDLTRSGTRREELLLSPAELEGAYAARRMLSSSNAQQSTEMLISLMQKTRTNDDFVERIKGWVQVYEKEGRRN
ncbi:MAG: transcription termination factor Rho [Clostridiales bacterium]|nr:transcription termination factor Rho [Clostridiales bacterium]